MPLLRFQNIAGWKFQVPIISVGSTLELMLLVDHFYKHDGQPRSTRTEAANVFFVIYRINHCIYFIHPLSLRQCTRSHTQLKSVPVGRSREDESVIDLSKTCPVTTPIDIAPLCVRNKERQQWVVCLRHSVFNTTLRQTRKTIYWCRQKHRAKNMGRYIGGTFTNHFNVHLQWRRHIHIGIDT